MSVRVLSAILAVAGALVIVLIRLRLARGQSEVRRIGSAVLNVQLVSGATGTASWLYFLFGPKATSATEITGVVGLACWWIVALCGLLIMMRWKSSRGRHARGNDSQGRGGPALSVAAHLGTVVAVGIQTWLYLTSAV